MPLVPKLALVWEEGPGYPSHQPLPPGWGGPVDPGFGVRPPVDPGYGHPGFAPGHPSHPIAGQPPRPDQGLPPVWQPRPDNTLPGTGQGPPGEIDNELPALPAQGYLLAYIPGQGWVMVKLGEDRPRPDHGLPGGAQPK